MSVRPCAKVMYTKIQERIKVETGSRNCQNFDPNARSPTKLEPNEIFNDFSIFRSSIDRISSDFFYFKGMDLKIIPKPIGSDRTISEVGSEWKFFLWFLAVQIKLLTLYVLMLKMLTRSRNSQILKPMARRFPKLEPNKMFA